MRGMFDATISLGPVSALLLILFGLMIGSFLNVAIYRLPIMMTGERPEAYNLLLPRSACPDCGQTLHPAHNIPVLSYLFLGGKCAQCGVKISLRYPVVELLTAAAAFIFICFAICIAAIDLLEMLIPDLLSIPLLAVGLMVNLADTFAPFLDAVGGAAGGFLILWALYWAVRTVTGKEALGFGDFKLLAALGAWVGWLALPFLLFIAALLGSVAGIGYRAAGRLQAGEKFPFAPFLVVAGVITLLWGTQLMRAYWSLFPGNL